MHHSVVRCLQKRVPVWKGEFFLTFEASSGSCSSIFAPLATSPAPSSLLFVHFVQLHPIHVIFVTALGFSATPPHLHQSSIAILPQTFFFFYLPSFLTVPLSFTQHASPPPLLSFGLSLAPSPMLILLLFLLLSFPDPPPPSSFYHRRYNPFFSRDKIDWLI